MSFKYKEWVPINEFQDIVKEYDGYDIDDDEIKEIEHLSFLQFEDPSDPVDRRKLVVVIVESQLLKDLDGSLFSAKDLMDRLYTLKHDLLGEGRQSKFLQMEPYCGPIQKDGKTLLAIREFFKSVKNAFSTFEGVLLIGSFPEAAIIRTWPQNLAVDGEQQYRVGCTPGYVKRFDIVLADLSGNWDRLYHETAYIKGYIFNITSSTNVSINGSKVVLTNPKIEEFNNNFQDVFWIKDATYSIDALDDIPIVELDMKCVDPEVAAEDRQNPNPIAKPDICVSRINARSIAVQPPESSRLLDANGKPQKTSDVPPIDLSMENWWRDPILERKLLIDYLDRNHAFRSGNFSYQGFNISLIESRQLGTAAAEEGLEGLSSPSKVLNATLLDFTRWLKHPAIFRAISTHSDSHTTQTLCDYPSFNADALLVESESGGYPWRWIKKDGNCVPSFEGLDGGDLCLYRTLWENGQLAGLPPSLLIHIGCDVNCIDHPERPYCDPLYGTFQNAESLLFYANQLSVICHVTWWNRGPMGFGKSFGASTSAVMGDGWKNISKQISQDLELAKQSTERKQNYIWGIVGDWTLKKQYEPIGQITGTVTDSISRKPIIATVKLLHSRISCKTDLSGNFSLRVPSGSYLIAAEAQGYKPSLEMVTVGGITTVNFILFRESM